MTRTPVDLEVGKRWTIASARDWPGWCRRGKGEEEALATLVEYGSRYAKAVGRVFVASQHRELTVVERLPGTTTTDLWAPSVVAGWEHDPPDAAAAERLADLLERCWRRFDAVVAGAPAELRKGPRGGGRDRDKMAEHVLEADRAYARKIGVRMPPRTSPADLHEAVLAAVREVPKGTPWPARYFVRRSAWHALDHAWEMEDRTPA